MRVAIVMGGRLPIPAVKGGGVETLLQYLIDENEKSAENIEFIFYSIYNKDAVQVAEKYHKTTVVYIKEINILQKFMRGAVRHLLKREPYYSEISYKEIENDIKRRNIDKIVIENTTQPIVRMSKKFQQDIFFHVHNTMSTSLWSVSYQRKVSKAITSMKQVIAVSEYEKKEVMTFLDKDEANVTVLENCLDFENLVSHVNEGKIQNIKGKYGIQPTDKILIYTGRICPEKGVLELVTAFLAMEKENSNIKLMIVGGAESGEAIETEYSINVKNLASQTKNIIFTGYVNHEDIGNYYAIGDIAIFPSLWEEPFGLVLLEAMLCGICCIVTNSGAFPQIGGDAVCVVSKDDYIVENLKESICELLYNDEKRNYYAFKGKEKIKNCEKYRKEYYYTEFVKIISK